MAKRKGSKNKFLGKNLRFLRTEKDLQQGDMRKHCGISSATWSNYENSVSEPNLANVLKISNFFGISINELLEIDIEGSGSESQSQIKSLVSINQRFERLEKEIKELKQKLQ